MKHAMVDKQLVTATSGAPALATCPRCGGVVKLRGRQGTYFWRHVRLPRGGCPPRRAPDKTESADHTNPGAGT